MGFGLIFVGYATLLLFKVIPIELIGFFVIYLGLDKLEKHCSDFRYAKYMSVYLFLESIISSVVWLSQYMKIPFGFLSSQTFSTIEDILYHAGLILFHLALYHGIAAISKNVGYDKGIKRSRFALVSTGIFYIAELCSALIPGAAQVMTAPLAVFQILWLCINLFMIYGCYMMIVTDDMLEKEEKKYTEYLEKHKPKGKTTHTKAEKRQQLAKTRENSAKATEKSTQQKFKATQNSRQDK